MRRIAGIVVLVVLAAGCHSSKPHAATTTTRPGPPRLDVVLDDAGLHLPAHPIGAAEYLISFEDRRSHPAGRATLQFEVPGPQLVVLSLAAGSSVTKVVLANVDAHLLLDGRPAPNVPVDHPLDVRTTPEYPTPAT